MINARTAGATLATSLATLLALVSPPRTLHAQRQAPPSVAFTGVHVVDLRTATATPNQLVVVGGGRIVYAGDPSRGRIPPGSTIVDGRGRYLIPGLWDMHVHLSPGPRDSADALREYYFALLIANGVTGVRDMGGNLQLLSGWRAAVRRGDYPGPSMVIGGHKIAYEYPAVPGAPHPVRSREQLRQVIALLKSGGADHVKVLNLEPPLLRAAGEESRAAGLPLVGHLPPGVSADSAIAAGYRSIEHLHSLLNAAAVSEAAVLRDQARYVNRSRLQLWFDRRVRRREPGYPMLAPQDFRENRLLALAQRARAANVWFTPTLRSTGASWRQPGELFGPGPASYRRSAQHTDSSWALRIASAEDEAFWDLSLRSVSLLHRGGAGLLAGTDLPLPATVAGSGLHDELALLVRAGLPPAAALRAATTEPAAYLAAADSLGSVAAGYVADLVLLDANPLVDIEATRRIRAVVLHGRLLQRRDLDSLLARAAELAAQARSRRNTPSGPGGTP